MRRAVSANVVARLSRDIPAARLLMLALGVQIGTAASPLLTGALAAVSLPGAFVAYAAVALSGAAVLAFGTRGLR